GDRDQGGDREDAVATGGGLACIRLDGERAHLVRGRGSISGRASAWTPGSGPDAGSSTTEYRSRRLSIQRTASRSANATTTRFAIPNFDRPKRRARCRTTFSVTRYPFIRKSVGTNRCMPRNGGNVARHSRRTTRRLQALSFTASPVTQFR